MRTMRVLLVVLLLVLSIPVVDARAETIDTGQVDALMADLMKMYDVPGASLALVKDGQIVYTQGYGVRDTTSKEPVTPSTLFAIASMTKSFTTLGVMTLVKQGKLDLDKPIIDYLPEFKLSDAEATKTVTLRQVMSHTSGLPRADQWVFDSPSTREEVIRDMADITLSVKPGQTWQYNNQNFVLAGYIIEKVTGKTWEDFTREQIFKPLGMTTANFGAEAQQARDHALPHEFDVLKGMQPISFMGSLGPIGPAGSINASAEDMARYALFQLGDGDGLVTAAQLKEMHTAQVKINQPSTGDPILTDVGYGLGWITAKYQGYDQFEHGGNIFGFSSTMSFVPDKAVGVVLLTNGNVTNLFIEVARLSLLDLMLGIQQKRPWSERLNELANYDPTTLQQRVAAARSFTATPADFDALIGDYEGALGINVMVKDGTLIADVTAQKIAVTLVPYEKTDTVFRFLVNTTPIKGTAITFKTDSEGTVRIYQEVGKDEIEIGVKRGAAATVKAHVEPGKGRYSFVPVKDTVVIAVGDIQIMQTAEPLAAYTIVAFESTEDDLLADLDAYTRKFDPTFSQKPDKIDTYTAGDGTEWTSYEYKMPSDQVSLTIAIKKDGVVYSLGYLCKLADREAVDKTFAELVDSFKFLK